MSSRLVRLPQLDNRKLNGREKNGETLGKASIERVTLVPSIDKEI